MKKVILMRHGEAQPDHVSKVDRERTISGVGMKQLDAMCQKMHTKLQGVDLVLCSNARRARQTFDGIRKILPTTTTIEFEDRLYQAPARMLLDRLHRLDDKYQTVFMIGHNPGLQEFLTSVIDRHPPDMIVKSFHTGSAAFFEMKENFWLDADFSRLYLKGQVLP